MEQIECLKCIGFTYNKFTQNKIYKIEDDGYNYYIMSDENNKIIIDIRIVKGAKAINWRSCSKHEYNIQIRKEKLNRLNH